MPALPAERSSPDRAVRRRRLKSGSGFTLRQPRTKATSRSGRWPRFRMLAREWRATDWPWH